MKAYINASPERAALAVNLHDVLLPAGDVLLEGDLAVPIHAEGFVVLSFATPHSRREHCATPLSSSLHAVGLGTLHLDLLTKKELNGTQGGSARVSLQVLSSRLSRAASWLVEQAGPGDFPLGLMGFQRSGDASLLAAIALRHLVRAVVAEGQSSGLASAPLGLLQAPALYVSRAALPEPGLQKVAAELARQWLHFHLLQRPAQPLGGAYQPVLSPSPN